MKLWFENSEGKERVISDYCDTWEDVNAMIDYFIDSCNACKITTAMERYGEEFDISKVNQFKRYYTRVWEQKDGRTRIDVGSHTEFFIWEGKYSE